MERRDNPRCTAGCDSLNWPPGRIAETTATNDHFTLVEWDEVNSAVSTIETIPSQTEPGVILRSSESDLLSPAAGFFAQPELGLHANGKGATNVYFDDFGLRTDNPSVTGFLPAVQY